MADDMNAYADFGVKARAPEAVKRGESLSPPAHSSMLFKEEESSLGVEVSRGIVEDYQELVSFCQKSTVDGESLKLSEYSGEKVVGNDLSGVSTECARVRTGSYGSNIENCFAIKEAFDSGGEICGNSTNDVRFVDLTDKKDFEAPRTYSLDSLVELRSSAAYDETKDLLKKERGPRSFLETKKMQLLKELEMILVHVDKPQSENATESNDFATMTQDEEKRVVNLGENGADSTNCRRGSLRIEVVDETALIDSTLVSQNRNRQAMAVFSSSEPKKRKEMDAKKKKLPRRKGKERKKISDSNLKTECFDKLGEIMNVQGSKKLYSRKDMEVLRFTNAAEQRKLWKEIYNGFIPSVAKEYDELASFKILNPSGSILHPPQAWAKNVEAPAILSGIPASGRWSRMNIFVH